MCVSTPAKRVELGTEKYQCTPEGFGADDLCTHKHARQSQRTRVLAHHEKKYPMILQSGYFARWNVSSTRQYTATHGNTLQHTAIHCNTLQHTATHGNTLQHTATHCNTLQHVCSHTAVHTWHTCFFRIHESSTWICTSPMTFNPLGAVTMTYRETCAQT